MDQETCSHTRGDKFTSVDLDLHRYQCTQCGKIMYYSGAAQRHYEQGEDNIVAESIRRGHNELFRKNRVEPNR